MARKEGYRWRRSGWQPSERQREVLDLLAEGKSNAEIAEAMGITLDGAKWHISELLAETGCEERQALASWWRDRRERRTRAAFWSALLVSRKLTAGVTVAAFGLLVLTSWLLLRGGDDGGSISPEAAADFAPTATATSQPSVTVGSPPHCDTALPGGFRNVMPEELRAQGMVEFGRVIVPRSCPLQVANRADMAFLCLADGGEIDMEEAGLHLVTTFGAHYRGSNFPPSDLGFYYEGEQFRAAMWVQDEGRNVFVGSPSANVAVEVEDRDRILLTRTGGQGAFVSVTLEGELSGRREVAFDSKGRLFFDPEPLPGDLVANRLTGESIDGNGHDSPWRGRIHSHGLAGCPEHRLP